MNRSRIRIALVALAIGATLASSVAEAQWVLLARKVVGRVEQMSQQQPDGDAAYDSAAVMIEVPAEKVYAVAVRNIQGRAGHYRHRTERHAAPDPVFERRADRGSSGQRIGGQSFTAHDHVGAQRDAAECSGDDSRARAQTMRGDER
jgi:hypothetical protein